MRELINQCINANKVEGITSLNGKLYFYEEGIVFKAQSVNSIIIHPMIEYRDISSIKKRKILGLVPNGISITTKNNKEFLFAVFNRNEIIDYLKYQVEQCKG